MFNPGETVCQQFTIPFVASELSTVVVTYKQNDDIVFEKSITSDFEAADEVSTLITITFSQEESLLFKEMTSYSIQLNVVTLNGSRASSNVIYNNTGEQHHKEVIGNE